MASKKKVPRVARESTESKAKKKTSKKISGAHVAKSSTKEPKTMGELLAEWGESSSAIGLSLGDRVRGKVIKMEPGRVYVDIEGKSEGLVAEKAYKDAEKFIRELHVGDEIEAQVLVPETREGFTILSLRRAMEQAIWKKIEKAFQTGDPIDVLGKSSVPAGLSIDIWGLGGFIPTSQLGSEISKASQQLIGKHFPAKVIDFDRESKKIVLSEKEVSEREELAKSREAIRNIKEGDTFEGKVTTIYDFGCFVRIAVPIKKEKSVKGRSSLGGENIPLEGLVHISELSWDKVKNPSDVVSVNDKVKVTVIGKRDGKLALSIRKTQKDPWEEVDRKFEKDKKAIGKVVRVSEFGTFVALEPGIEGLIHITKIPPGQKLKEGDNVNVYIEGVDKGARRISLGLILTQKPVGYK